MTDAVLNTVKTVLRRNSTTVFDAEIQMLINSAVADLNLAGVYITPETLDKDNVDALLLTAICTYCKCNFGETDEYEHLKASYDEQKAQLQMSAGYAKWRQNV